MGRVDIKEMEFAKIYELLANKLIRKGKNEQDLIDLIHWLCGYTSDQIMELKGSASTYGQFFKQSPCMNPLRNHIKGKICGVTIETIDDPIIKDMRILDKLVDDLAKGKSMDRILPNG